MTNRISDAAITAGAHILTWAYGRADGSVVVAVLEAALPHLGEAEYSVRTPDGSVIDDPTGNRDQAAAYAAETGGTVVRRTVITTEWTEVES